MSPDDPAVQRILRRAMVARLATLSRTGRPHVNPLYFDYRDDRIQLGTADGTLAARNVRSDPRVAVLFEVEREPGDRRVLRIHGLARVLTDRRTVRAYLRRDVLKYVLTPGALRSFLAHARQLPLMRAYVAAREKGQPCVIEVVPERAELLERA